MAKTKRVSVAPAGGELDCPVILRSGVRKEIGKRLAQRGISSAVIVSNDLVAPLYADDVARGLGRAEIPHTTVTVRDGESSKSLDGVRFLYELFLEAGLDRDGVVIALGGGVITDLAGFAAATYLRGVHLVQAPTTLLAMVDAGIGGKVGVNLPRGKNLVGAFKRALFVAADPDTLETLPDSEVANGLAEVVKAAIIGDPSLFTELESGLKPTAVERIQRAAAVKRALVAEDPYEQGRRIVLNLGHTFGHAIERVANYGLPHGQAVAVGLVAAARLSARLKLCAPELAERIQALLTRLHLPTALQADPGAVLAAMNVDKKRRGGQVRFVLPRDLGHVVVVDDVPASVVLHVLREMLP